MDPTVIIFVHYKLINKNIMARIIRLTESDLARIVRRVIKEEEELCIDFKGNKIPCKGDGTDRYGTPDSCIDNNYKEIPCKNDGTDRYAKLQKIDAVSVHGSSSHGNEESIEFILKNPDEDGNLTYLYIPSTGYILGDGDKNKKVLRIQHNQTEEQVRSWFKRNRIHVEKF